MKQDLGASTSSTALVGLRPEPRSRLGHPATIDLPERDEFRRDIFWLVHGANLAFWLCVGIAVWNNWDAIRGWFAV